MANRNYHFFTSSTANWQTHGSLRECMRLQENRDKQATYMQPCAYSVFKVDLPADAEYGIKNYAPNLDADQVQYIDTVVYQQYKSHRGTKIRLAKGNKALVRD